MWCRHQIPSLRAHGIQSEFVFLVFVYFENKETQNNTTKYIHTTFISKIFKLSYLKDKSVAIHTSKKYKDFPTSKAIQEAMLGKLKLSVTNICKTMNIDLWKPPTEHNLTEER